MIVATDPPAAEGDRHWTGGNQHAQSLDQLFRPKIVDREQFYRNASFRAVNMNAISTISISVGRPARSNTLAA
jgi:hypothetical protein